MSLEDLNPWTFSTEGLKTKLTEELTDLLETHSDYQSGRLPLAKRKEWALAAWLEYLRLTTNSRQIPFDGGPDESQSERE